ncbi:MAG: hypothetical protein WBA89_21470 [Microcoleus sp.]|uniref:hypothetical protein n=1 Tax=Microcoleus sp. TaxID=44472 RepID=UPI003C7589AB
MCPARKSTLCRTGPTACAGENGARCEGKKFPARQAIATFKLNVAIVLLRAKI